MRTRLSLLVILLLFALPTASLSQTNWDFALTQDALSGPPGSTLVFAGSVTNATGSDLILNSAGLDFDTFPSSSFFDIDFADEFINTGLTIPQSGYTGPIFFVRWHADAPASLQGTGIIEIFADPPADPESILHEFSASVSPAGPPPVNGVPEPGVVVLMAAAMLTSLPLVRRVQLALQNSSVK